MSNRQAVRIAILVLALFLRISSPLTAATINVANGDDLQARINHASGGDVLLLGTGTYRGFKLEERHFTEKEPLIIKAAPGTHPIVHTDGYDKDHLVEINRCSYVVLDGLEMTGGNRPIYCQDIDHVIFIRLVIHDTGQEIIHVRGKSRFIDVRDCRLFDTGHKNPQWSEGVYIGMGSPPIENVEHVWIEGNEIYRTGNSEGINLKSQTYHATIRGNKIHDIAPGTPDQHNEAAISCEAADLAFRPGEEPDIWIEDNEVYNVTYGRWANGIKVSTAGGRILRNHIHDCAQFGIAFNDHLSGPGMFTTIFWENVIETCRDGDFGPKILPHEFRDPGPNPNQPQTWYTAPPTAIP